MIDVNVLSEGVVDVSDVSEVIDISTLSDEIIEISLVPDVAYEIEVSEISAIKGDRGQPGKDGKAATIRVGTVSVGGIGAEVSVTNSGTEREAVFDFVFPKSGGTASDDDVATEWEVMEMLNEIFGQEEA